ncbi:glycosyltransferase family 4 protein [bacterium]|jgi:glycosyltransferase involved in cell wall biosynthesis|nr:glycosyltransferase family 4 protein [bacterium]MBT4648700.1 glycosyltransferase family 4 protein [bacterium]
MNIGIDIRALSPVKRSGVGNYVFHAIEHLISNDQNNQYYLFSSGWRASDYLPVELSADNIHHVHYKTSNKLFNLRLLLNIAPKIDKLFPVKLDLFWLPNINFLNLSKNLPMILTVHDLSFLHSKHFYSLKRKWWHTLINVRRLVDRANKIIAVSDNTKRDIMRFFTVAEDKVKVIYPGASVKQMDKVKADKLLAKHNLPAKFYLFLGTLEPRKNIAAIIKAFDKYHQEYPDTYLVLVGNKGWVYQKLLRSIKKRTYIKYLGFIPSPIKDALYFSSQGLIWPSFYEGFGFPPLEATFHGRPVITSYKTSLPEIMRSQALYVDPYNSAEIYQLLKSLREDKDLLANIKNSSQGFFMPVWSKQVKKIIKLFEECV